MEAVHSEDIWEKLPALWGCRRAFQCNVRGHLYLGFWCLATFMKGRESIRDRRMFSDAPWRCQLRKIYIGAGAYGMLYHCSLLPGHVPSPNHTPTFCLLCFASCLISCRGISHGFFRWSTEWCSIRVVGHPRQGQREEVSLQASPGFGLMLVCVWELAEELMHLLAPMWLKSSWTDSWGDKKSIREIRENRCLFNTWPVPRWHSALHCSYMLA